jgi:ATP:corrinoid adenosyltransferase
MQENVKFCLFIVTQEGWHSALPTLPAHSNVCDIVKLENIVQKIKPGLGVEYVTQITKCDELLVPLDREYLVLERHVETLKKRNQNRSV